MNREKFLSCSRFICIDRYLEMFAGLSTAAGKRFPQGRRPATKDEKKTIVIVSERLIGSP